MGMGQMAPQLHCSMPAKYMCIKNNRRSVSRESKTMYVRTYVATSKGHPPKLMHVNTCAQQLEEKVCV